MSRPFFISPRELIGWIVLLDTFIALMLWWGLAESFWIAMVYSHAIGSSILLLQEIVRRQLWPDASCFPPVRSFWWMMAVLVPPSIDETASLLGASRRRLFVELHAPLLRRAGAWSEAEVSTLLLAYVGSAAGVPAWRQRLDARQRNKEMRR